MPVPLARRALRAGFWLIVIGLLLLTGLWEDLIFWLRAWRAATGLGESFL